MLVVILLVIKYAPQIQKEDKLEEIAKFLPILNEFLSVIEQEIIASPHAGNLFLTTDFGEILLQLNRFLNDSNALDVINSSKTDSPDDDQMLLFNETNLIFVELVNRFCDENYIRDLKESTIGNISKEISKYDSHEKFETFIDEKIESNLIISKNFLKQSLDIYQNHKEYFNKLIDEKNSLNIQNFGERNLNKINDLSKLEVLIKKVSLELFFIHNSLEEEKSKLGELRKLLSRFKRISFEELSILLNFKFIDSLKLWIEGYREILQFKIEKNELIFSYESESRDDVIRDIDKLLEEFDKWEKSAEGKNHNKSRNKINQTKAKR